MGLTRLSYKETIIFIYDNRSSLGVVSRAGEPFEAVLLCMVTPLHLKSDIHVENMQRREKSFDGPVRMMIDHSR